MTYDPMSSAASTSDAGRRGVDLDAAPFNPTPVHLVRPPNLKQADRWRRRPHALFDPDGDSTKPGTNRGGGRSRTAAMAADVLALYSSGDSDESDLARDLADDSDDDDDDTDSDYDSEEEAWPVGPVNSIGVGGWRKAGTHSASHKGKG